MVKLPWLTFWPGVMLWPQYIIFLNCCMWHCQKKAAEHCTDHFHTIFFILWYEICDITQTYPNKYQRSNSICMSQQKSKSKPMNIAWILHEYCMNIDDLMKDNHSDRHGSLQQKQWSRYADAVCPAGIGGQKCHITPRSRKTLATRKCLSYQFMCIILKVIILRRQLALCLFCMAF